MTKKKLTDNEIHKSVEAMFDDLDNIKGFITQEVIKFAQSKGGKVPFVDNKEFQGQVFSLLNANPDATENKGRPVLSLKATEMGIESKIQSLKKKGADPKLFDKLVNKIQETKTEFSNQLSSNDGIKKLVGGRVVDQILLNKSDFMILDANTKEQRFLKPEEKQDYVKALSAKIEFSTEMLEVLLDPKKGENYKEVQDKIYKKAIENFSNKLSESNIPILNSEKLQNQDLLNKFSKDIEPYTKPYGLQMVELEKNLELEGKKVDTEIRAKFSKMFEKINNELGSDYINQNIDKITQTISQDVKQKKTFLSNFRSNLKISSANLEKISDKVIVSFRQDSMNFQAKIEGEKKLREIISSPEQFNKTQEELVKKAQKRGVLHEAKKIVQPIKTKKLISPASLSTPPARNNNMNKDKKKSGRSLD